MILPNHPVLDPIVDGVIFTAVGFALVCLAAFIVKLTNAPVSFDRKAAAVAAGLRNEVADLRTKITTPIPDIVIDTRKVPEILTRSDDESIVHIIITDFHLTNRSGFAASLEVRIRFNMGGIAVYANQDDSPLDLVEEVRAQDPSIGRHLGRRISLASHEGLTGYLCYRIYGPVIRAAATANSMMTADFLNTLEQTLEIIDHVSGIMKSISFRTLGPYSFRELEG